MEARDSRLAGENHHGTDAEFPLVGYCFDNAYVAWHVLTDAGFDCTVIKGTTERVADDLLQADVDPRELESIVELGGHEHFWVEAADADGQRVVVDIASETWDHLGECLVREALPTEYIMLEDSRAVGEQTFETVREENIRCRSCGDHAYSHGGCPACEDTLSADLSPGEP